MIPVNVFIKFVKDRKLKILPKGKMKVYLDSETSSKWLYGIEGYTFTSWLTMKQIVQLKKEKKDE